MRLKSIKLAGFKSFVDPTHIPFPNNLTAIVGPNGCGKSNTIDAVRWVMGESSAKNLRGEAMTDVIFNGSTRRKPVAQCTVELIFDNSDHSLTGPYAQYNEISIKRKVTRDGQSSYYLNNSKCRRRDITDLFAGTGLGPRSYAIIEQGMISRLIESKPEELRVFLEEAAGISKYKDRRRETENRMRRTQENLERLTDIREELQRQLAHLERQAQAAEKYRQFKSEEKQQRAYLSALRWREFDAEAAAVRLQLMEGERDREQQVAELREQEAATEDIRLANEAANERFQSVQKAYYETGNDIARLEQQSAHQRDKVTQLQEQLRQIERDRHELRQHHETDQAKLEELDEQLELLRPELLHWQEESADLSLRLQEQEVIFRQYEEEWLEYSLGSAEAARQTERLRSRIEQAEHQLHQLNARRERLRQELSQLEDDPATEELSQLDMEREAAQLRLEEAEAEALQAEERIQQQREQQQQRRDHVQTLRQTLNQQQQEITRLQTLLHAQAGDTQQVKDWLNRWQLHRSPQVMEQLDVPPDWAQAVEWVLGHWLQSHIVPAQSLPESAWQHLPDARLSWLDDSVAMPVVQADTLAEGVKGPAALLVELNRVHRATNLADARARLAQLNPGESLITPEGVWLGRGWTRVFRSAADREGVLAQQQRLETLITEVDELDFEVEDAELNLNAVQLTIDASAQQWQQQRAQLDEARRNVHTVETRISALSASHQAVQQSLQRYRTELRSLEQDYEREFTALNEARSQLAQTQQHDDTADDKTHLRERRDDARQQLETLRNQQRQADQQRHSIELKVQSLQTQADALRTGLGRAEQQQRQLDERAETLHLDLQALLDPDDSVRAELEEHIARQLDLQQQLEQARAEAEGFNEQIRGFEQQRLQLEQRIQQWQQRIQQHQMDLERLETRKSTVEEQVQEQNYHLPTLLENLPPDATVATTEQQIEQLTQRIQRLGPINLAAIDEYAVQNERKQYLDQQNEDLERALETLEGAIRKIDKETRNRFKSTFDQVNQGLQELFPKVFGGGHAYLEMTGEDLLDTGVAIMARPPGKKNATIHLLSGGEKALTAIALVFSIFRLNPAPFCMLDEVDAPLDDANVARFSRLVEAMSEQVEFIYITHNKVAMEIAHQLMGVTMNEPGVSRLVSVNLDEAVEMVAS
ncbi:chromosome segregation protein SMC [Salinispirillum marinum]|uniref:Chromosome partition protein Smc n=2 Tax=Saccharospirillaceae TaxID=255527 RepID=A0ABV8BGA2_9GAMM